MADDPKQLRPGEEQKGQNLRDYVKAESMLQLALAIPAGCFIGWALGAWLDRHFHTGWIAIAGILLDNFQRIGKASGLPTLGYTVIFAVAFVYFLLGTVLVRQVKGAR